jgi:rSAM/selenodomain-associated transferase 2
VLPLLSIIVPARDDAAALTTLLTQLTPSPAFEVIVAIAGPVDDGTMAVRQRRRDVQWIESVPGRGAQLNTGAARATGDWLWFVHADSQLPHGWLEAFCRLARSGDEIVGGAFRFALDSSAWQARLLERAVAWRVQWLNLPYGDQGIFVRRTVFQSLGGFASLPLMEDVEFISRLKRCGRLRHLTLSLTTSARRWEHDGWLRRSAKNLAILGLYRLGVSPERLARRYYGRRTEPHADQKTG